jgi:hypothetical protein
VSSNIGGLLMQQATVPVGSSLLHQQTHGYVLQLCLVSRMVQLRQAGAGVAAGQQPASSMTD